VEEWLGVQTRCSDKGFGHQVYRHRSPAGCRKSLDATDATVRNAARRYSYQGGIFP